MRLLTINSFDCSAQASGGVNQTTVALTTYFTKHCGIHCFLGFFEPLPSAKEPLPLFEGRISLNRNLDREAFARFLTDNHIDVVQVNFLKKQNLVVMPALYEVAHQCGARVIYAFHMCPGFQIHTYGSWERMLYGWLNRDNALAETKKWVLTKTSWLWKGIARRVLQSKYRVPYENCDKQVVLSKYYFPTYLYYAGVADSNKMTAIGNALRFNVFATEQDVCQKQKTVIVVARFDEDTKRISYVLRAWRAIEKVKQYAEWKLQLVGDGRDKAFYHYLVKKWNLQRVEFTGQQDPQEYYRRASLFLMTSTAEGWGMVLTEAQQMGVPVVAMDSFGALHDIIEDGYNGRIVANNDLVAFQNVMMEIMEDEAKRTEMALHAIESSKRYEIQHIVLQWQKLFEQMNE
ncbi:MAG: glycosyltransferase [Paludibacteraceae bacterium]|nr:glycosyltransferase [Paludibacteraceae bacterium]